MKYNLMDHLLNPVIVTDDNLNIIYYNHICSTYFKLPPRKLNKINSIENLIITDQLNISEKIKAAKEQLSPILSKEVEISLPESNAKKQTVILKFIPFENDIIIHLWDFSIEKHLHEKYKQQIQELRETHEQIMQSDKLSALGELIAGIGHEVSNPLTIISDRIYRIEENLITANMEEVSDNIKDIDQGVKRISKIVSNLQSFIKNQDEELQIVSLEAVIIDSMKFISDLEILQNIKILTSIKKDVFCFSKQYKTSASCY